MAYERSSTIQGMRELADFLEAHPLLPLRSIDMNVILDEEDEEKAKAQLQLYAQEMGTFEKAVGSALFWIVKKFSGGIDLGYFFSRQAVCTPRVVGKRKIRKTDYSKAPTIEVEEDVLEWDCPDSILSSPSTQR